MDAVELLFFSIISPSTNSTEGLHLTQLEIAALAWSMAFWRNAHQLVQSPTISEHSKSSQAVPLLLPMTIQVNHVTRARLAHGYCVCAPTKVTMLLNLQQPPVQTRIAFTPSISAEPWGKGRAVCV